MRASAYAAALAVSAGLSLSATKPASAAETTIIPLKLPSGRTLKAELMLTPEQRQMGLMFRPSLPEDQVLLFVFGSNERHSIWMMNCKFPIDIVWLDAAGKVVDLVEDAPPCKQEPCPIYAPFRPAAYVVEMNAGAGRREKVSGGTRFEFTLPSRP